MAPARKFRPLRFRGQEMKFPLATVMKNLLHMFTASVGNVAEGQCPGVQNCGTEGKLAFLPCVVSLTNRKNQFVVRRTWIFSRKMTSGMSYQVLYDLLQIVGQEVTLDSCS